MSGIILLILRFVFTACLYLFLGWAIYTLWQELKRQSKTLDSYQIPPINLHLEGDGHSRTQTFSIPEISLGRNLSCDFCLEDHTVSTEHARLIYQQGQWWVEDLRSTNGTFLNQLPVHEAMVVTSGDELQCGQVIIEILIGEISL
ncbi:MAG: FHA domain-containing protein [Anaerolineales bacterium]|nr:FHA domain-containing protein [Anaerolineales bacterium]